MNSSSWRQPPTPQTTHFTRLPEGATTDGVEFEFKLAGLATLRARSQGLHFEVNSNVAVARPFDDVLLRLVDPSTDARKWRTYFLQLEHKANKQALTLDKFKIGKKFDLKKYFEFFLKLRNWHRELEANGETSDLGKDERKLCEGSLDDCRFIIYTTRVAWSSAVRCEEQDVHQKGFEILRTGGQNSCVFHFSKTDTKIWNLLSGDDNETVYQQEFLPKLRVFCGQALNNELESHILEEINALFGVLSAVSDYFHPQYLKYLKRWAADKGEKPSSSDRGDRETESDRGEKSEVYSLTETSGEYEWFMAQYLRERARKSARLNLLDFQTDACTDMKNAVNKLLGTSGFDALIVEVPGMGPGLRAAKLLRTFDPTYSESWVYVGSEALTEFPLQALEAVCKARHCEIIILDLDSPSEEVNQLLKAIKGSVKIIDLGCSWLYIWSFNTISIYVDLWRLDELTDSAHEGILNLKVVFQGTPVQLRDLEETWPGLRREVDGALLEALVLGKAAIGQPPPPAHDYERPELYIQRRVDFHRKEDSKRPSCEKGATRPPLALDYDCLELDIQRHVSFCTKIYDSAEEALDMGMPVQVRELMKTRLGRWRKGDEAILEAMARLRSAMGQPPPSAHDYERPELCIQRQAGILREEDSKRPSSEDDLLPRSMKFQGKGAEENFTDIKDEIKCAASRSHATLLLDVAGAGKSSFFKRLAVKTREQEPIRWSIFVPVLQHRKLLQDMPPPSEMTVQRDLMKLLVASAEIPARAAAAATQRCLQAALVESGAVTVFVDGVDELCPAYKDKVLRLLELLLKESKACIWVSSRSEVNKSLKELLDCATLSLLPITPDEQKHFLQTIWPPKPGYIPNITKVVLKLSQLAPGLLGSPLHLRMIADIGYDRLLKRISNNCFLFEYIDLEWHHAGHFVYIYHEFAKIKFEEYKKKHFSETNLENSTFHVNIYENFLLLHQNCAIFHLLADNRLLFDVQQFEEYVTANRETLKREKTGIMWMDEEENLHFSHYSFAEYFSACWLSQNLKTSQVARNILCGIYASEDMGLLKKFIDWMLTEDCPLHRALVTENIQTFFEYLQKADENVDKTDKAGRTALHIAVLKCEQLAVQPLLLKKCDLTVRDKLFNFTALQYVEVVALHYNSIVGKSWKEIAGDLLQSGANTSLLFSIIFYQTSMVFSAICNGYQKLFTFILEHGITVHNFVYALHEATNLLMNGSEKNLQVSQTMKLLLTHPMAHQKLTCTQIYDGLETSIFPIMLNRILNTLNLGNIPMGSYGRKLEILEYLGHKGNREIFPTPVYNSIHQGDAAKLRKILKTSGDHFANNIYGIPPLILAVLKGHKECVECLLQHGASVNGTVEDECAPINVALENGNIEMVKVLLERGADINLKTDLGQTPLYFAIIKGHIEIVDILIANGYDENLSDEIENSPLHYATAMNNVCLVTTFCKAKANPNSENSFKVTPLHYAAITDAAECAEILLRNGADVNAMNTKEQSSIHLAALHGSPKMLKRILVSGEKAEEKDIDGCSPLMYAAWSGNSECVEHVLQFKVHPDEPDNTQRTPLHYATEQGHSHITKKLLDAGANANAQDSKGVTPLILAVRKEDKKSVEYLLERKADPNVVDGEKTSPLHVAAHFDYHTIMETILEFKGNVNTRTEGGNTEGETEGGKHKACVESLLKSNVNLNDSDGGKCTALHASTEYCHIHVDEALLEAGADVNVINNEEKTPLYIAVENENQKCVELLLNRKADPNITDIHGRSPLYIAVAREHIFIIRMLVDAGANVNASTSEGVTPLSVAAERGHTECVIALLKRKPNLNAGGEWSPLHAAAQGGHLNIVEILLHAGIDVNARDSNKDTPLIVAARSGNSKCVEILLKNGAHQEANAYGLTPALCAYFFGVPLICRYFLLIDGGLQENEVTLSDWKVRCGNEECLKLLLKGSADRNAINKLREVHLHMDYLNCGIKSILTTIFATLEESETSTQLIRQYFEILSKSILLKYRHR